MTEQEIEKKVDESIAWIEERVSLEKYAKELIKLQFIHRIKQLTIPLVVGQSEQLKTFNCINLVDDGFDPCKEQCLYCRDVKGF